MLCVVIKGPTYEEICQQIQKAITLADCIELRLDLFTKIHLEQLQQIRTNFSIPMIFTLRSSSQGGNSDLSGDLRLSEMKRLIELKPDYIDLEYPTDISLVPSSIQSILSYHDLTKTPLDLQDLYEAMQKIPSHFYKIATLVSNTLDVMKLLCWAKTNKQPNCTVIGMGPAGQLSRLLSPVINNPLTYAALEEDPSSSLGQLSADLLIKHHRIRSLTPQTALYALIGDPVAQSVSYITHNAHFQERGLNAVYVTIQVTPSELPTFLYLAKQLPFQGFSVTMPLKEAVIPCLDEITSEAKQMGAVNTLLLQDNKWIGSNTDGKGTFNAIEKRMKVQGKHVVILGAGGAARAIAYEAHQRGASLTILNRHVEKAELIARMYHAQARKLEDMQTCTDAGYDILINCAPVDLPIESQHILPRALVMDIRSRPKETLLLKMALEKGCSVIYGHEMFIEQALLQYDRWHLYPNHLKSWPIELTCTSSFSRIEK